MRHKVLDVAELLLGHLLHDERRAAAAAELCPELLADAVRGAPRPSSPRPSSPRLSSSHLASPLLASPLLTSPLLASPLLASPLLTSPRRRGYRRAPSPPTPDQTAQTRPLTRAAPPCT